MARNPQIDVMKFLETYGAEEEPPSRKMPAVVEIPKTGITPEVAQKLVLTYERLEALRQQAQRAHNKALELSVNPETRRKAGGRGVIAGKWTALGVAGGIERGQASLLETWAALLEITDLSQAEDVMRRIARGGK